MRIILRIAVLVAVGISFATAGCKSGSDDKSVKSSQSDHPTGDHPKGEHPQGEHPQGEHPANAEHPK